MRVDQARSTTALLSSDAAATVSADALKRALRTARPSLDSPTPRTLGPAQTAPPEVAMQHIARPTGRPDAAESQRRTQEFVRLILDGAAFDEAARQARVKPVRALAILSQPEVRQLIALDLAETAEAA